MLMVVFGAGASFDSYAPQPAREGDGVHWRPPLARELFSRAELYSEIDKFPACRPIVPRLYALPGGISLEEELERYQREADDGDTEREIQLAAVRYYLQYVIAHSQRNWSSYTKGVSNYKTLLDQIRRWKQSQSDPICLVTFNYDSLLEEARSEMLRLDPTRTTKDYIATDYKIFMLHGSVKWACEIDSAIPEVTHIVETADEWTIIRMLINRAPDLAVSNRYRVVGQYPISAIDRKTALFPAIAIPVQRKQEYECPEDHVELLDELLPRVDRVIIVGWRGREERFVAKMVATLQKDVRSVIVSGNPKSAAEVRGFLQASGYPGRIATAEGGFTGFVLKEQLGQFLAWKDDSELQLD